MKIRRVELPAPPPPPPKVEYVLTFREEELRKLKHIASYDRTVPAALIAVNESQTYLAERLELRAFLVQLYNTIHLLERS